MNESELNKCINAVWRKFVEEEGDATFPDKIGSRIIRHATTTAVQALGNDIQSKETAYAMSHSEPTARRHYDDTQDAGIVHRSTRGIRTIARSMRQARSESNSSSDSSSCDNVSSSLAVDCQLC